jgi:hypothetical protein
MSQQRCVAIWFGDIDHESQRGEGRFFLTQGDFYLSPRLLVEGGEGRDHICYINRLMVKLSPSSSTRLLDKWIQDDRQQNSLPPSSYCRSGIA